MNWLIVYTGKNSSKNDELKQFFKKNKIKAKSFLYEKDSELSVNSRPATLKDATHCVILDEKAPAKNRKVTTTATQQCRFSSELKWAAASTSHRVIQRTTSRSRAVTES